MSELLDLNARGKTNHYICIYKWLVCFQTNYACNYEINQGSFDLQI